MNIKKRYNRNNVSFRDVAIYFSGCSISLNAAARDALGDPDFVKYDYDDDTKTLIMSVGKETDYKVSKVNCQRFTGGCLQIMRMANISIKEKIFGTLENGNLKFEIKNHPTKPEVTER